MKIGAPFASSFVSVGSLCGSRRYELALGSLFASEGGRGALRRAWEPRGGSGGCGCVYWNGARELRNGIWAGAADLSMGPQFRCNLMCQSRECL